MFKAPLINTRRSGSSAGPPRDHRIDYRPPQRRVGQASTADGPPPHRMFCVNCPQPKNVQSPLGIVRQRGPICVQIVGCGQFGVKTVQPWKPVGPITGPAGRNSARATLFGLQAARLVVHWMKSLAGHPVPARVHPKVQSVAVSVGQPEPNCDGQPTCVQPACWVWHRGPQLVSGQNRASVGQASENCVQKAVGGWVSHRMRVGQASTADGLHWMNSVVAARGSGATARRAAKSKSPVRHAGFRVTPHALSCVMHVISTETWHFGGSVWHTPQILV